MGNISGKVWGQTELVFANSNIEFHRIDTKKGGVCSKHKHNFKFNGFYCAIFCLGETFTTLAFSPSVRRIKLPWRSTAISLNRISSSSKTFVETYLLEVLLTAYKALAFKLVTSKVSVNIGY